DYGAYGSSYDDIVVTSGAISGGSGAVALGYGNDSLTLEAGWSMTGRVLGGDLVDTLKFGGSANASFDLGFLGTGLQYDEFEQLAKIGT
ncbi:hypothetical protein OFN33_29100, partial [Escherichia coli]|nr:hypothetical protein [Escherichia coli]